MSFARRLGAATALLASTCFYAYAGPRITVGDPPPATPVGLAFSFQSNAVGGGVLSFTNASGVDWTRLDFRVTLPWQTIVECDPGLFFTSCESSVLLPSASNSLFNVGFTNPSKLGGIAADMHFTVNLNDLIDAVRPNPDPNGPGQWGPNTRIDALANVPEPRSLALLGLGLALGSVYLISAARRRRTAL